MRLVTLCHLTCEWHEPKNQKTQENRGFGFELAQDLVGGEGREWIMIPSPKKNEERWVLISLTDGGSLFVMTCVWRRRGTRLRVISFRKGNLREKEKYQKAMAGLRGAG